MKPDDDYHIFSSRTIKLESSCQTFPDDFNVLERYRAVGSPGVWLMITVRTMERISRHLLF